jgi:hypothetical protein
MADKKFSEFTDQGTGVDVTDWLVGLYSSDNARFQVQDITKRIQLDTGGGYSHASGQISYDTVTKTGVLGTGYSDVCVNIGQELHIRFYNDTGVQIDNGELLYAAGVNAANDVLEGDLYDGSSPLTSVQLLGMATHDVPDGTVGLATLYGEVRDFDTSGLAEGSPVYGSSTTPGGLTNTFPLYPNTPNIIGVCLKSDATNGIFLMDPARVNKNIDTKSKPFSSNGISSGVQYIGGYYKAPDTDSNLTQASTTQVYGTANGSYAAHAFIVAAAAGVTDGSDLVLTVTGTSINDSGVRTTSDSEIVVADATAASTDQYLETSKKWIGQITYTLSSTGGTTFNFDFNYGFAKYEDYWNVDFTVAGLEVTGLANATDSSFDIELLHHKDTGWTYAATGFVPGDGAIAQFSVDHATESSLINGDNFAWKRDNLTTFVSGGNGEGILWRITTGQNNSVQIAAHHARAVIEELVQ